jgi:hypothetical protein
VTSAARVVTENPALRRALIPAYRLYARSRVFRRGPRVLVTSMPKAGTHLLASLLKNMPGMMFSGHHHALHEFERDDAPRATERNDEWRVDWNRVERTLRSVNKGQYMTAHFPAEPHLVSLLKDLDYKVIVVMRDPRDTAVSSAFYLSSLERHFLYERFQNEFTTPAERLLATITGFPPRNGYRGLGSIGKRIDRAMEWFAVPGVLECRFENLIGSRGGGSDAAQSAATAAVATHLGLELDAEQLDGVRSRTWSPKSTTFRKGRIGEWRDHFTEEHKAAFKEVAGRQLIELGYERDLAW